MPNQPPASEEPLDDGDADRHDEDLLSDNPDAFRELKEIHLELADGIFHMLKDVIEVPRLLQWVHESLPEYNGYHWGELQCLYAVSEAYFIIKTTHDLTLEQKTELVEMLWSAVNDLPEHPMEFEPLLLPAEVVRLARYVYDAVVRGMLIQERLCE